MNNKAVFDDLVCRSARELFQGRGVALLPSQRKDDGLEYAATIGFSSDNVRGMLGLGMSPDTLQKLMAREVPAVPPGNSEDWLAESVNQLLGRLKNKLMRYDLMVSLALPTVLRGISLRFLATRPTSLWTYTFESEEGPVWVWLDVRHDANLELKPTTDPEKQSVQEGDLLLF